MRQKGVTFIELIVTVVILVISFLLLSSVEVKRYRYGSRCKANLDQLGKSLKLYTIDFGRSVRYPKDNGSGFLTALYRENILVENSVYLCSQTLDFNDGVDLARIRGEGHGYGPISYAGRKNINQEKYPGIFKPQKDTTITTMAADDWNDGKDENHANIDVVIFLFLDGHSDHVRSRDNAFANYSFNYDPLGN